MRNKIIEQSVLFVSVLKWVILASGIGFIVGVATAVFLKLLKASITLTVQNPYYFYLLPIGLFLSALIVKYLAREAGGYGIERVIESVHKKAGRIKAIVIPVKLAATILTAVVGGSVGQIGPCAQIGGSLASACAAPACPRCPKTCLPSQPAPASTSTRSTLPTTPTDR